MGVVNLNGLDIYYSVKGSGKPLIFLHGIFSDSKCYENFTDILAENYKVFAIDLPMHGGSGNPKKKLKVKDLSDFVGKFINEFKLRNPVICAHSGSTLIAINYASRNKVSKLMLIEPVAEYYNSKTWLFLKLFVKSILNFFKNPFRALESSLRGVYNIKRNFFNKYYWSLINDGLKKNYASEMKKIKDPVVIYWGKYEGIFPFKLSKEFGKKFRRAKVVEIKGSHDWPILWPEKIRGRF
jgi:pimeloyl-ACP methyl ester carboxylesterase